MSVGQIVESESHQTVFHNAANIAFCIVMEHHFVGIGALYQRHYMLGSVAKIGSKAQGEVAIFHNCGPMLDDFQRIGAIGLVVFRSQVG